MYTVPTIVTSEDLTKRAYVTFYLHGQRVREYNGNSLHLTINPNRAKTISQRDIMLEQLRFEIHKALDAGQYYLPHQRPKEHAQAVPTVNNNLRTLLTTALENKLNSGLSKTYKRDLDKIYKQFTTFLTTVELDGTIESISPNRIEQFLSAFGSSGTYYMNKRRNLSILFSASGRLINQRVQTVKETQRRRSKSKLHKPYEKQQLKPILSFLEDKYPKLYVCCLLTYSCWLRPHEEVRHLKRSHFKNNCTEIHLSGTENKGGKVRVVYIPDYVVKVVKPLIAGLNAEDNFISGNSQTYSDSYFNTQWSRAWKRMYAVGLIQINQTIYSFRHTAAIEIYRRTKDVYLLQKLLGHSTIVVTLKYLRSLGEFNSEELRNAAPTL